MPAKRMVGKEVSESESTSEPNSLCKEQSSPTNSHANEPSFLTADTVVIQEAVRIRDMCDSQPMILAAESLTVTVEPQQQSVSITVEPQQQSVSVTVEPQQQSVSVTVEPQQQCANVTGLGAAQQHHLSPSHHNSHGKSGIQSLSLSPAIFCSSALGFAGQDYSPLLKNYC
jgi:hypothetical protein